MTWTLDGCISMQNLDVVRGSTRVCMIDCDDDRVSDYDVMANARLIAAAPDLLAALEYATGKLADFADAETDDEEMLIIADMTQVIRAAIARAKA